MKDFLELVDFDQMPDLSNFVNSLQSIARATHHEDKDEVEQALIKRHQEMFLADRGVYTLLLSLAGSENHITTGVGLLFGLPDEGLNMPKSLETLIIKDLLKRVKITQLLRFYVDLADAKINNNRARKVILRSFFDAEEKDLTWWAVKYKTKLRYIMNHFVGNDQIGYVISIAKRYATERMCLPDDWAKVARLLFMSKEIQGWHLETIAFINNVNGVYSSPLFRAFQEAKRDITKGASLPPEVLEGIRSVYHPSVPHAEVLKLTAKSATKQQTVRKQREYEKAGVKVDANWDSMAMHELIKIVYEWHKDKKPLPEDIMTVLHNKAKKVGGELSFQAIKAGILVDNSFSGSGDQETALNDPISKILSLRYALQEYFHQQEIPFVTEFVTQGRNNYGLPVVAGETDLATPFIDLVYEDCDVIYVLSDGRDNAPAGRLQEVIGQLRLIKKLPTVYHFNPVTGGESIVKLDKDIPTVGYAKAEGFQRTVFASILVAEPKTALAQILNDYKLLAERSSK